MKQGGRREAHRSFWRSLRRNPGSVGAIVPSSRGLSRKMAGMLDPEIPGRVIELGGGTGSITRAILERGVNPEKLIVVEYLPDLARHLERNFPGLQVIQGDAAELPALLQREAGIGLGEVSAIVSSIPLRSLPRAKTRQIVEHWRALPFPESRVIQFTYDLRDWAHPSLDGFRRVMTRYAWVNLPPARVDWLEWMGSPPSTPG